MVFHQWDPPWHTSVKRQPEDCLSFLLPFHFLESYDQSHCTCVLHPEKKCGGGDVPKCGQQSVLVQRREEGAPPPGPFQGSAHLQCRRSRTPSAGFLFPRLRTLPPAPSSATLQAGRLLMALALATSGGGRNFSLFNTSTQESPTAWVAEGTRGQNRRTD